MIREFVIQRHTNTSKIHHVIGHHGSVFLKLFLKCFLVLLVLMLVFLLLDRYIMWEYLSRIFAGLGFMVFIKFCINFLNMYLDALVMTETGIVVYLREGLLEYKTEVFDRDKIETILHTQKGLRDKLFFRGDITIKLNYGISFPFENIPNPKKQADKIQHLKAYFSYKKDENSSSVNEEKGVDILVEALGEVVKDYIDKGNKSLDEYGEEF
ncbi:MAG TPA: hypothetical protein PLW94_00120 [Candidatus Absconditabacterales bacterium]|nr:hypothetical protein [Candidatus Absconditabacterales bacterium]